MNIYDSIYLGSTHRDYVMSCDGMRDFLFMFSMHGLVCTSAFQKPST